MVPSGPAITSDCGELDSETQLGWDILVSMLRVIGLLLLAFGPIILTAQSQTTQRKSITGIVVDSVTGQPIPGTLVRLIFPAGFPKSQSDPYRFVTQESGQFSFETEAGRLELAVVASRTGFRSEDNLDVATVLIRPGDTSRIIMRLVSQGVISGRVLNK